MAEVQKYIRVGDTITNVIDSVTGRSVNYEKVTDWVDGSTMDDSKVDGRWFRKLGGEYFRMSVDPNTPYNTTISEIRTGIGVIPYMFRKLFTTDEGQEGEWELVEGGTFFDNTGTRLVTETGLRIRRIYQDNIVNVRWFGADPSGNADSTAAIQAAVATGDDVFFPIGTYNVSDEIIPMDRQVLYAEASSSWTGSSRKAVIRWTGEADNDKAVLRLSREAVGEDPGSSQVTGVKIKNLFVDANQLAGFGIYGAYLTGDSVIDQVTVARANVCNLFVGRSWYLRLTGITAYQGNGNGVELGNTTRYAWAGQVNALTVRDIRCHSNGRGGSYDQDTNRLDGYGLGVFDCIAMTIENVVSENNDGAGIVYTPGGRVGFLTLSSVYLEGNGVAAVGDERATYCDGLIVNPRSTNSRGWLIKDIFLFGESGNPNIQNLVIQGSEPTGSAEPITLENIWGGNLRTNHDKYRLIRSYFGLGISGRGISAFNNNAGYSNEIFSILPYNTNSGASWGMISYFRGTGDNNSRLLLASRVTGSASTASYHNFFISAAATGPNSDNAMTAGEAANRYSVVYAGTGAINTSDANEKRDIRELTESEGRVAVALKGLVKAYRFKDAYEQKGGEARIHFGVMAQDVAAAFIAEGLDPNRYALFCKDEFYTHEGQNYTTGHSEIPEGAVKVERLGIRYDELLAFIISAI